MYSYSDYEKEMDHNMLLACMANSIMQNSNISPLHSSYHLAEVMSHEIKSTCPQAQFIWVLFSVLYLAIIDPYTFTQLMLL